MCVDTACGFQINVYDSSSGSILAETDGLGHLNVSGYNAYAKSGSILDYNGIAIDEITTKCNSNGCRLIPGLRNAEQKQLGRIGRALFIPIMTKLQEFLRSAWGAKVSLISHLCLTAPMRNVLRLTQ